MELATSIGRASSPVCGALIAIAGTAGLAPIRLAKRTAPFRHAHRRHDRIVHLYDVIRKWVQQVQTGSLGSTGKVAASPQFLIAFRVYRHPERSRGISMAGSESQDAYVGKT